MIMIMIIIIIIIIIITGTLSTVLVHLLILLSKRGPSQPLTATAAMVCTVLIIRSSCRWSSSIRLSKSRERWTYPVTNAYSRRPWVLMLYQAIIWSRYDNRSGPGLLFFTPVLFPWVTLMAWNNESDDYDNINIRGIPCFTKYNIFYFLRFCIALWMKALPSIAAGSRVTFS